MFDGVNLGLGLVGVGVFCVSEWRGGYLCTVFQ